MPAELVESPRHDPAGVSKWERRGLSLGLGRVGGVARHAGDAHDAVVGVEVGLEVVVGDRPVVGDTVESLGTEVGRMKAREVGAPVDGAAADGVVHQGRDGGVGIVDGVVFGKSPDVGIGVEVSLAVGLPVGQRLTDIEKDRPILPARGIGRRSHLSRGSRRRRRPTRRPQSRVHLPYRLKRTFRPSFCRSSRDYITYVSAWESIYRAAVGL